MNSFGSDFVYQQLKRQREQYVAAYLAAEAQAARSVDPRIKLRSRRKADRLLEEVQQLDVRLNNEERLQAVTVPPPAELRLAFIPYGSAGFCVSLTFRAPDGPLEYLITGSLPVLQIDHERLFSLALEPVEYGRALSTMLFAHPSLLDAFDRARERAFGAGQPLRVRLMFPPDSLMLISIRWELLCDPFELQAGRFLATNAQLLLARTLPSDDPTPLTRRIGTAPSALIALAAPTDLDQFGLMPFDVTREAQAIQQMLQGYRTNVIPLATPEAIADGLRNAPDVLYLVAHGRLVNEQPHLLLLRADGTGKSILGSEFVTMIRSAAQRPHLVVLAACRSAGNTFDDLTSHIAIGPQLARSGIAAVLAMLDDIAIDTVVRGLPIFCEELVRVGEVDRAVARMRAYLSVAREDWWQPVLFLREL